MQRKAARSGTSDTRAAKAVESTMRDALALRAFLVVAEEGNFTRAASRLHVHTATVSRLVSGLEAALGVQLLDRTTRRASLTEAGAALLVPASKALAALQLLADLSQSIGS